MAMATPVTGGWPCSRIFLPQWLRLPARRGPPGPANHFRPASGRASSSEWSNPPRAPPKEQRRSHSDGCRRERSNHPIEVGARRVLGHPHRQQIPRAKPHRWREIDLKGVPSTLVIIHPPPAGWLTATGRPLRKISAPFCTPSKSSFTRRPRQSAGARTRAGKGRSRCPAANRSPGSTRPSPNFPARSDRASWRLPRSRAVRRVRGGWAGRSAADDRRSPGRRIASLFELEPPTQSRDRA